MSTNDKRKVDVKHGGDGYRIAVKRRKGVPKSSNKDMFYTKRCSGCEDTSLAKAIHKFEKTHRRMVCTEDVVNLFHKLQVEEPHAEIVLCTIDNQIRSNYYASLYREVYSYDDKPIDDNGTVYYQHVRRKRKIVKKNTMTFEEIIEEHKQLLKLEKHNELIKYYEGPQSGTFRSQGNDQSCSTEFGFANYQSQFQKVLNELEPIFIHIKTITPNNDKYLDVIEDMIFISYVIMYCNDSNILLGTLLTVYKKHSKGSLSKTIYDFISHICFDRPTQEPHAMEFRQYANKILQLNNSILFSKIRDGLSLCIALGFINPVNISIRNIKLFSCTAANLSSNCTDFVTYVLDLVLYFFETGYQLFSGDYDRIFDMNELSKIDEDLVHLKTYISNIQLGSYEDTTGSTIEEYHAKLVSTIDSLKMLSSTIKDKTYKSLVLSKLTMAYQLLVTFDQSKPLSGLRESPFSLSFFGNSSVGKSSAAKMVLTSLLSFNGKSCKDEHICVIQPTDKFYSTYKANVTGVIIDDLCNTRSEKAVVDPAQLLISIVNNIPYYAPKSESHEKGKINVRPAIVVTTTNVQHLEAHIWSNEPISVVRRLKYHITVKVRPQFMTNQGLDSSKVTEVELEQLYTTGLQDLWLFDVFYIDRYVVDSVEKYKFTPVTFEGKVLRELDIYNLVRFLNITSKDHFAQQRKFVEGCKNSGLRHKTCPDCCYPKVKCVCGEIDNEVQGGTFSFIDDFCNSVGKRLADYLLYKWSSILPNTLEKHLYIPVLKLALVKYMESSYLNLINYIPYSVRETQFYRTTHYYIHRNRLFKSMVCFCTPLIGTIAYYTDFRNNQSLLKFGLFTGLSTVVIYRYNYSVIMQELQTAPLHTIVPFVQSHQCVSTIFKVGVSLGGAVLVLKVFKSMYNALCHVNSPILKEDQTSADNELQGNLNPTTYSEILDRDKEVNIWSKTTEKFIPNTNTSTMTSQQLLNVIKSNVLNLTMDIDENTGVSIGCIALKSNIFCCPLHFFKVDKNIYGKWRNSNVSSVLGGSKSLYKLKFVKHDGESGNIFTATIDYNDIVQIEGLDLCIFKVDSGGSFPDILKYCVFNTSDCNTITIRRDRGGILHYGNARATYCKTSYTVPGFGLFRRTFEIKGGRAYYSSPTSCGDCMMVHIRDSKDPSIIGFHISGSTGTSMGSYTMFTMESINNALEKLQNIHHTFTPHSGSFMNLNRLGTIISIRDDIPSKAPVSYIKDHNYVIRGSIDTQVSYFTDIKKTFMCSKVEKIFGMDNIWGGPKFGPQRWKPWYTFLSSSASNDNYMDSSLLKLAVQDYMGPLFKTIQLYNQHENVRPLTHHEIINGIPGKRFIDHMNFKSAIGFPLRGKKSKYLIGEPTNFDFESDIFSIEYDKMKDCYLKGERYYPIFKASLKDEPVKQTKEKVRVFQAADITLQYGWRKFGLPILRFLSMYPLLSECAVGVNPYSEEWNQIHNHLTFDGAHSDRIIAGDYKSWDQKLPASLVLAAFDVIVRLAQALPNYTSDDILIIKGLATDTTYYLSHFNGTLIEFNNGLPSGHNLTAHINSIANSILLRYGYYLYKNPAPFRKYCHAITYGDDFECGTDIRVKNFDHVKYKSVVDSVGMILTMPDKTSDAVPFLHIDDCDFLKRRSIKCDIDGLYYGALEFDSMIRSLMVRGKTSISDRDHAYSVIRGFIHDLSYHQREKYDYNIIKVRELLEQISMIMPEAYKTYDEYYHYRRRNMMDYDIEEEEDVLDDAITPDGYPVTPEASGSDETLHYYVSSSENSPIDECNMESGNALTNNSINESYPSTKVSGEYESRSIHDDSIQAEVFGQSEDNINSNIVTEGTAVLTSSAEHSMQTLPLTSPELLSLRQDESRSLGHYLSRPRAIYRYNPGTDGTPTTIPPLLLFLGANLIRDKIRNYAYINGIFHIKVVVVGSPTMAGSQLIALHPWFTRDNGLGPLNFGDTMPDLSQMSQLPSVMTDLSREKGGEISLPIICPSNGLDITENLQIADAFALHYMPVTPTIIPVASRLRPQIIVYAWMTDVELTGTTLRTELPQADEYHRKPHEVPSSDHISLKESISKAGGKLVGKATELGISKAMSAMGFSNPNDPTQAAPNVPKIASNMSTYNAPVNIESLAGDIKNEVTVDSKVLGYEDNDHMNLNNLMSRWTIVNAIQMTTGTIDGGIEAYNLPVTPMACRSIDIAGTNVYTPTALSMAALPFNRWRGTITYRFQAVGTAFMKGKIKISHDVKTPTTITESNKTDTQILNSVIWDIATTNTIEIKVPWASNQVFKQCGLLRQAVLPYGLVNTTPPDPESNGSLVLNAYSVLNDAENSAVWIVVSVKGEPGMVFGDMRAVLANYTFAGIDNNFNADVPQSVEFHKITTESIDFELSNELVLYLKDGTIIPINNVIWTRYFANRRIGHTVLENIDESPQALVYETDLNKNILTGDSPGAIMCVNINGLDDNITDHDELAMVCMGEKFYSIRQIIKRYTQNWTRTVRNVANSNRYYRVRLPDRPIMKGWQGNASLNIQPNNIRVTYARDSFLSFYSAAFLGYRGSLRHKIMVRAHHNATSYADQPTFWVTRSSGGYTEEIVPTGAVSTSMTTDSISTSASAIPSMPDFRAGGTIGYAHVNPVLEYATPYYSRGKFCWAQDRIPQVLKESPDGGYDVPWHQIIVFLNSNTNLASTRVDKFVAAGDDFSLYFYLYGPRMVLNQPTSWPQSGN